MKNIGNVTYTAVIITLFILMIFSGCKTKKIAEEEEKFFDISISEITETPTFFSVTVDNINMEIMAFTAPDGAVRIALNRCERCYKSGKGFIQEDNRIKCLQCNMYINIDVIGIESGGCNPIPIPNEERILTENMVKISHDVLSAYTHWFTGWETEQTEETEPAE